MSTKLTLTVEKNVIEQAKLYAKKTGRSLSELIEAYLVNITDEDLERPVSATLKNLVAVIKLPKNFDEDKELRAYYEKKHL